MAILRNATDDHIENSRRGPRVLATPRCAFGLFFECFELITASETFFELRIASESLALTPREEVSDAIRSWRGLGDDKRFAVSSCALRFTISFLYEKRTHEMPTAISPWQSGAQQRQGRDWAAWTFTEVSACRPRTRGHVARAQSVERVARKGAGRVAHSRIRPLVGVFGLEADTLAVGGTVRPTCRARRRGGDR